MINKKIGNTHLIIKKGDITKEQSEVIVNAANSALENGGGVNGAIHQKAGPGLDKECRQVFIEQGRCNPGDAVVTSAGSLEAKWIIHTVGPIWKGGKRGEEQLLRSCYYRSLALASHMGAHSIAFPSISTGIFHFPIEQASKVALKTIIAFIKEYPSFDKVTLVLFSEEDFELYKKTLEDLKVA